MTTCSCGARIADEAHWCPVCLKSVVDREKLLAELHDTFRKASWTASKNLVAPPPPKKFSRWESGPLTLGPRVKVTITVLVVAIAFYTILSLQPWAWLLHRDGDHPARAFAAIALVFVVSGAAAVLRALWKRTRVE